MEKLDLDLSGIGVVFERLPAPFANKMATDWARFVSPAVEDPALRFRVRIADPNASGTPFEPHTLEARMVRGRGELSLPGGHARLESDGRVDVELDSLTPESYFNMINLSLASLALHLPTRGALVLHAACLLIEGRAFALVGTEGAGKSTWTELGLEAGLQAVSDDLLLLEGSEVLGNPFRSRHLAGRSDPGRWPLAALLFPRHGVSASLAPTPPLLAHARLTANLPFVSAQADRAADVAPLLDTLVATVNCHELTFARDPSFISLLRSLGA